MKPTLDSPPAITPFTLIVDTREQLPFRFTGIPVDGRPGQCWIVNTERKGLASGDYSIAGMEHRVACERKSQVDLMGCLGRDRERFQAEIERLETFDFAAVIVEADWQTLLFDVPPSCQLSPKTVSRTILSWSIRYRTKWFLCMNRRHAELTTFHLLKRFYELSCDEARERE